MPSRSLPSRLVRVAVAALVMTPLAAVLVLVTMVAVGRASEVRCQRNDGWTHGDSELPLSLRCLGRQDGHEVVLDDATTYVRVVFAISASVSGAVFVVALVGVRRALGLSSDELRTWWSDFP